MTPQLNANSLMGLILKFAQQEPTSDDLETRFRYIQEMMRPKDQGELDILRKYINTPVTDMVSNRDLIGRPLPFDYSKLGKRR